MSIPKFTVTYDQTCPDRFFYIPHRPLPNPERRQRQLRVEFTPENNTLFFDENGRPCDLHQHLDAEGRQKIQSRRKTPKSNTLASDD